MASPRLIAWRVTYAEPCTVDGDEVLEMTPFTVRTMDGRWHRRSGSPFESWHETEQEARQARLDWMRARWDRAVQAMQAAQAAYVAAMEGE